VALYNRYQELHGVELAQLLDMGPGIIITEAMTEHIRVNSIFISSKVRKAVNDGLADLWGRAIAERVHAVVNIAHPEFRESLLAYAREQQYVGKA